MAMVVAFVESLQGELKGVARETVGVARKVADALNAEVVAFGGGRKPSDLETLGSAGAAKVIWVEDERLDHFLGAPFAEALQQLFGEDAVAFVFPATRLGKELAPRLAARLRVPMLTDVISLSFEDQAVVVEKPLYAGKVIGTFKLESRPLVLSHRPKAFMVEATDGTTAPVEVAQVNFSDGAFAAKVVEVRAKDDREVDVQDADIVVSGGRGMGGPENFKLLYELAEVLTQRTGKKVAVGASRAAVDAGWMPHSHQVGQTGKVVSPELYMAIGISGALQHLAGMRTSRVIVAINKDPEAPIFKLSDFGVVDDLFKVVPELTKRLREEA